MSRGGVDGTTDDRTATGQWPEVVVAVGGSADEVVRARATVRSARTVGLACLVVDVDGAYCAVSDEDVVSLAEAASRSGIVHEVHAAAATLDDVDLIFYAGTVGATVAAAQGAPAVVVVAAGVVVLSPLAAVLAVPRDGVVVTPAWDVEWITDRATVEPPQVTRSSRTGWLSWSGTAPDPVFSRALYGVGAHQVARLRSLASNWRFAPFALDLLARSAPTRSDDRPSLLLSARRGCDTVSVDATGRPRLDGDLVSALDLSGLDPTQPWLLDHRAGTPQLRLSEHPLLAEFVAAESASRRADRVTGAAHLAAPTRSTMGPVLLSEARRADRGGAPLPDLLGLGTGPRLGPWALTLLPTDHTMPVARYLSALRSSRPDLEFRFRQVPGADVGDLAEWALRHGPDEYPGDDLLRRAAQASLAAREARGTPRPSDRPHGVNVFGYLAGELGLGESARLVLDAFQAAGIPTSNHDLSADIGSRRGATYRPAQPTLFDTNLLCVNGADVPHVAAPLKTMLRGSRTIGMWYWELEEFPAAQQAGLAHVDEVWAATDFMRDAIARHAGDVPVRTVMPPLPQAGDDPGSVPVRFGIPTDKPWFLFTFDFLSVAARKNPYGLVEAFTRAFADRPADERPVLVLKTINAARHPGPAERLRLQIAGRDDIVLIDEYLDHHERHVLVSHCTAFVSLHRAEGLGLTIAEAMAWGRPVITTAYGGVMQFCTPDNSFLVDWTVGYVEPGTDPYEAGLPWADPDLDMAARLMQRVVDDPEHAARIGARAARDIRKLHNVDVAGAAMRRALGEGRAEWEVLRAERRAARRARRATAPSSTTPPDPVPEGGQARGLLAALRRRRRPAVPYDDVDPGGT